LNRNALTLPRRWNPTMWTTAGNAQIIIAPVATMNTAATAA
jgi:hypothetical protein